MFWDLESWRDAMLDWSLGFLTWVIGSFISSVKFNAYTENIAHLLESISEVVRLKNAVWHPVKIWHITKNVQANKVWTGVRNVEGFCYLLIQ